MASPNETSCGRTRQKKRQSLSRSARTTCPGIPRSNPSQVPLISPGLGTGTSTPVGTTTPVGTLTPLRASTPVGTAPPLLAYPQADTHTHTSLSRSTASPVSSKNWTRGPYFWRSFFTICIPLLLSALEGSVTNTALPTISNDLDLGTNFSWVATAFLLASTVFQPLYGQLADMYGRKVPMMLAVTVFAAGSAISGWSKGTTSIILGRVVQGFGTGGIDLFAEIILSDLVPLRQRGLYMSIKNAFFAIGTTVGPLLGGYFAEHNWRWCFWINMPVCAISFFMMLFWLRVEGGDMQKKDAKKALLSVDYLGVLILTSAVILLLVALSTGGTSHPWHSEVVIAPLVFGVLLLIVFPFWERSQFCVRPIMPPAIFTKRTSAAALALQTIHGFITFGSQFYLPVFFQAVKRVVPSQSGILVLPMTLTIVVMATLGGPCLSHFGKYRPIHKLSFTIMTVGLGLFMQLDRDTATVASIFMQFNAAFGMGLIVPTLLPAVQVELEDSQNGAAAGAWAFLRGTGSLFGVAVPGALFNLRFSQLLHTITNEDAQFKFTKGQAYQEAAHVLELTEKYGREVENQVVDVFTKSLRSVWIIMVVLAGIGLVVTMFERSVKMRKELDTQFGLSPARPKDGALDSWYRHGSNTPAPQPVSDNSASSTLVDLDLERGFNLPGVSAVHDTSQQLQGDDDAASDISSLNEKQEPTNGLKEHKSMLWKFIPEPSFDFGTIVSSGRFTNVRFLRRSGQEQ